MLSDDLQLYWGDAHTNLRPYHADRFAESFEAAKQVHDFWPVAYYPICVEEVNGCKMETSRQRPQCVEQWKTLCELTARHNEPGRFVCFPGYEWHGDRYRWGDHNVFYKNEDAPLDDAGTLAELYDHLRGRDGIAIPHHVAYKPGWRGKDWSVFDEHLSPFVEIFSTHGSSEGYGSPLPMERNMWMGPMAQAGAAQTGLARGLHFGFIASGDIHDAYPTQWGTGVMACYAKELTRESLWESFHERRVYGVTGDRIRLDFSVAGLPMGAIGRARPPYPIIIRTEGCDGLARIELLRNNHVIHTRNVCFDAGRTPEGQARYKFAAMFGWGPRPYLLLGDPDRHWEIALDVEGGELLGIEKRWNRFGQRIEAQSRAGCRFRLTTGPGEYTLHGNPAFQGMSFEIKGTPDTRLRFTINGKSHTFTLREARGFPTVIADTDEAEEFLSESYGITREWLGAEPYETTIVYLASYKAQVWPAVHEGEFAATVEWEDTPDRDGESWYYVRVVQNNGQMAWSSPIWVTPQS